MSKVNVYLDSSSLLKIIDKKIDLDKYGDKFVFYTSIHSVMQVKFASSSANKESLLDYFAQKIKIRCIDNLVFTKLEKIENQYEKQDPSVLIDFAVCELEDCNLFVTEKKYEKIKAKFDFSDIENITKQGSKEELTLFDL